MTSILLIILIILVLGAIIFFAVSNRKKPETPVEDKSLGLLLQQMNELTRMVDTKMGETKKETNDAISESQKLLREISQDMHKSLIEVAKEQTKTNEATRQFVTIAEQLSNLEKVLKHQKQRGNLGEASLELILSNMLSPDLYKMQYQFPNGETVDAVIMTKEGMIPVDAKFSLDNYDRLVHAIDDKQREELEKVFKSDLKKRIDETAKYIRPQEGTLPFAFMFIPAEAIYYDLLINEVGSVKVNTRNLIDYAQNEKKVTIISPTTFAAYLTSVLYGFKAFKFEKNAQEIKKKVESLVKHLKSYEDYHNRLGNALVTTVNHFGASSKEFKKIDKDVMRITEEAMAIDPVVVEKPLLEE